METVKRITPLVRSVAKYEMSLKVIEQIAASNIPAKSGILKNVPICILGIASVLVNKEMK